MTIIHLEGPNVHEFRFVFFRHIQEEFDHMFTKKEIRKLTSEEMAFAWFRYPKSIVSTLPSYMPILLRIDL